MNTSLYRNWWALTIKGVLAVIFGLIIFLSPGIGTVALLYYFAFLTIFAGIFLIIAAIGHKAVNPKWSWWLFEGILDILFGLVILAFPLVIAGIFIIFVGVWAIFMGTAQVIGYFTTSAQGRGFFLLSGIISIIFGIVLLMNPLIGAITFTMFIGIFVLFYGIFAIILSLKIKGMTA